MNRNDDRGGRRGMDEEWLQARFEMLVSAQTEFERDRNDQSHAGFDIEVLNMYNALEHHREHDAAADLWDEFRMDEIPHACNQIRQRTEETIGDFGVRQTKEETVVDRAPPAHLNFWTRGFKRIMDKLGLLTSVESESGDLYAVKRNPEEYDEPVKDGIQKPQ